MFKKMFEVGEIEVFCNSLGFKKKQVDTIKSVVKTETDLSHFKNFIIEKDGQFKSNLELVFSYVKSINLEENYSFIQFSNDFNTDKALALRNISKGFYNASLVEKVEKLLEKGLTLNEFYNKVVNEDINICQTITLLANE